MQQSDATVEPRYKTSTSDTLLLNATQ